MNTDSIKFKVKGKDVTISGYPELEGCEGTIEGDGMAFFFGDNRELYIANTQTGKIHKLSTIDGELLVDDDDIDFDVHFRKTKVCARFIILCAFTNSLHSSSPFICAF